MIFKPNSWLSEDERFYITRAYPKGFCAQDNDACVYYDANGESEYLKEFVDTFEEAVAWCEQRAKR